MADVKLYLGDCLDILPTLEAGSVDAVITDPPWGSNKNCDYTRFSGGITENGRQQHKAIYLDDQPFDPSPWLQYDQVILWGYQHFAMRLPAGSVLVWLKKRDNQLGTILSDAELAWQKGGKGVYVFRHIWNGFDRETDENTVIYYLQKFSDDNLMKILIQRMTDDDLDEIFSLMTKLMKKYLTETEYHKLFLKDEHGHH